MNSWNLSRFWNRSSVTLTKGLTLSLAAALFLNVAAQLPAASYTWGGGSGNWSDANWTPGPVSGPTASTDTATINSGNVSLNVGSMNVGSLTLGAGGTFYAFNYNGVNTYTAYNSLLLQGGTIHGFGAYHNWGAGILKDVTVSGSSPSVISASSWFNLNGTGGSSSVFDVANVTGDANTDLTVSASLADVSADLAWSAAALVKNGAGTMVLTAVNSYTGGTTVNGGTLALNAAGTDAAVRGTVTVNSGGTLTVNGAAFGGFADLGSPSAASITTLNIAGGEVINTMANAAIVNAAVNMTGGTLSSTSGSNNIHWRNTTLNSLASANSSTVSANILIRNDYAPGVPLTIDVANGAAADDLVISGNISQAVPGAGLTKTGTGTLELTGASANTYTGLTSVNNGTLQLNKTAGLNAFAGSLVIGDNVGGTGTAVVQLLSANQIPNGSTITINSDGVLDLAGNDETVGPLTLASGQVDGSVGSDTLTLAGTLSSSGTSSVGGANDTLDVNGNDVNVTGGTLTVTRTIEDGAGNQLVKNGAGTLEIAGGATLGGPGVDGIVNNAGTTTITSGTVDLQGGNIDTTGAIFNLAGGILQNIDTLDGDLNQSGGTLINTVNSPDTMTITGGYNQTGGTFVVDIAGNFLGDYDIYDVGGTATLDGVLKINLLGGFEPGLTGVTGIFWDVLVANAITIGPNFSLDTSMAQFTSAPFRGWAYEIVDLGDGRYALRLFVTPEPASVLVWGVAGLAALLYARRRRPASTGKPVAP